MATKGTDAELDALRAKITQQGGAVRQLKKDGAAPEVIQAAVAELAALRAHLDAIGGNDEGAVSKWSVNKRLLDETVIRRMIVVPSFEIHGSVAGLFDYGPPGSAVKENMLSLWRSHFVLEDNILQIECTTLTPYPVLKASGHVDKFEDLMVKDVKSGECFRADKLLEDVIDAMLMKDKEMTSARRDELKRIHAQAGAYKKDDIGRILTELGVKSPTTGNELTPPFEFNLMFTTSIGPTGVQVGFLRPETAQGMFVNFKRLLDFNAGRMPLGVAQIGSAYRNEIAPRGGLLRVREFTMAEIEYFVHPEKKNHAKFASVAEFNLTLFPREKQVGDGQTVVMTAGAAVAAGVINNETLAYFMVRTAMYLLRVGIKSAGLRFRQHLATEMAHYACDCWDAEILMSVGWVECVGIADRSAFDLTVHAKATKTDMSAREALPEPVEEDVVVPTIARGVIGKAFKADAAAVLEALTAVAEDATRAMELNAALATGPQELPLATGKTVTISKDMISFALEKKRVTERKYVPNVIEPSFGIGRILTGVLEHNFGVRDGDEQRAVLSFAPIIAPYKVVLLPLDARIGRAKVAAIAQALVAVGMSNYTDDSSASVGKRYSRADEIGVPFALTYDFDSDKDDTVTLRDRDSCAQIRLAIPEVPAVVRSIVEGDSTFADAMKRFTVVTTGEDKAAAASASAASGPAAAAAAAAAASTVKSAAAAPVAAAAVSAAPVTAAAPRPTGTVGTKVEGNDRSYGRFSRPLDL